MEYYLGEIIIWSAPWLPEGFMWCNGDQLSISQYQALYAIIGTTYGGNGSTTFALPDLRGVLPLGAFNFRPGAKAGTAMPLPTSNYGATAPVRLPAHTHTVQLPNTSIPATTASIAIPAVGTLTAATATPGNNTVLSVADDTAAGGAPTIYSTATSNTTLKPFPATIPGQVIPGSPVTSGASGSVPDGLPLQVNVPGVLSLNFLICIQGIFPSRA